MSTPITLENQVGYIEAEDVYVSYSEYYGDGTIYGRNDLLMPDGSPVKGAGKTKAELINANVTLSEVGVGTVTGDIVVVAEENATPAPAPEENAVPAPAPEESSAPAPAPAPEENATPAPALEEGAAPAPAPEEANSETLEESTNNRYTVSFSVLGFKLTREFTVKIEKEARKIYLS
jgi:hypothetical protein